MYALNKLVWAILNPAVLGVLLLIAGIVFSRKSFGRWILIASVCWFVFWTLPATNDWIGAPLESYYLEDGGIPSVESYTNADAIVVLGGGMSTVSNPDGSVIPEMSATADRVWQGARLYKAGKAPKIILTSKGVDRSTVPLLVEMGVPESAIEIHEAPRNTSEEAMTLSTNGLGRVLLVTSAWHMHRAELTFFRYAPKLKVIPAPTDWEFTARKRSWRNEHGFGYLKRFQPEAESLWRNSVAFKEWLGHFGVLLFW